MSTPSEPAAGQAPIPSGEGWKKREFWWLAGATYGIVALVTIIAAIAYYKSGKTGGSDFVDGGPNSIAIGTLWIPMYPSAVMTERASNVAGDVMQSSFRFKTKDSPSALFSFYRTKLKGGRYMMTDAKPAASGGMIQAITHGGKARISVVVTGAQDGSEAAVTAVEKVDENPLEAK